VMTNPPGTAFAVSSGAIATPCASVSASTVRRWPLPNRPLAPRAGAEKVTRAPETGLPFASFTVTASLMGKRAPTVVDSPAEDPRRRPRLPDGRDRRRGGVVVEAVRGHGGEAGRRGRRDEAARTRVRHDCRRGREAGGARHRGRLAAAAEKRGSCAGGSVT